MSDAAPRVNVLGTGISALTMERAIEAMAGRAHSRQPGYVCVAAAHSVMACWRDPELRRIFNRSVLTTPDGMPLVWLARLRGHRQVERVYGPDLVLAFCGHSVASGTRHYFYGGAPGVPQALAARLKERFPGLLIAGTMSPPFGDLASEADAATIHALDDAQPDVVWVGLGTGKQERWMAQHVGRIRAPLMVGVGAAFDFLSDSKPQAPRWIRRVGLEWLFRLLSEPARLWRRYLDYPLFVLLVCLQLSGLRRYPPPEAS